MRILLATLIVTAVASLAVPAFAHEQLGPAYSHTHESVSEITPLDGLIGLEKTTMSFHASPQNSLPWGFVEGRIANPVQDYPVIIQMFSDGDPAHFAQTDVNPDGTYEYKFRVLDIDGGQAVRTFLGDYTVVVYKVVYLDSV